MSKLIDISDLQFYMTQPAPCPYLPDREERKLFTTLDIENPISTFNMLAQNGFRRSHNIVYRPACQNCRLCLPSRIVLDDFDFKKRWRRIRNKNSDLVRSAHKPFFSRSQYELLSRYTSVRHREGGMDDMSAEDYAFMIESSPVQSLNFEYRFAAPEAEDTQDYRSGELAATMLVDAMRDGLSLIYSFFDPQLANRSLGTFMILDLISYSKELDLSYLYLGFWVPGSPKMHYKQDFTPLEVLLDGAWVPIDKAKQILHKTEEIHDTQ